MRTLATALALCLAATSAEAFCSPGDLGCQVHGGSGAFGRDSSMLRDTRPGSDLYINRTAPAATAQRRRIDDWRAPAPWSPPDTAWRDLQLPEGEAGEPWAGAPEDRLDTPAPQAAADAPYAPAATRAPAVERRAPAARRWTPSNSPQGPADSPQGRATSFFDSQNARGRR